MVAEVAAVPLAVEAVGGSIDIDCGSGSGNGGIIGVSVGYNVGISGGAANCSSSNVATV